MLVLGSLIFRLTRLADLVINGGNIGATFGNQQ